MDLPAWGWLVVAGVACVLALGAVAALRRVGGQGRPQARSPLAAEAAQADDASAADPALMALVRRQRDQLVAAADKQRQLTEELRVAQEAAAHAAETVDPALRNDLDQARQGAQALREQHAGELARLAQTAITQIDALQQAHLAELTRLRGAAGPSDTAATHAAARAALGSAR